MKNRVVIGVSKLAPNYGTWLERLHDGIEFIDLYAMPLEESMNLIHTISGILLTGGSDIHPAMYDRPEDLPYCKNFDETRDKLEKMLIEKAFHYKIPLLGICRGQQVLNVVMKGTLYPDIPVFCPGSITHSGEKDVFHPVHIRKDSLLYTLTGVIEGSVNSAHHQVVNAIGPGLLVSAHSEDNLIEAMEAGETIDHPFCLSVQWHPERMGLDNPLSGLVGRGFIKAVIEQQREW